MSFGGDICPQTRETKVNINKCNYTKLKSFGTAQETINKMKSSTELREKRMLTVEKDGGVEDVHASPMKTPNHN